MIHKFQLLISFVLLWSKVAHSLDQKQLTDLREFRIQGVGSRFAVSGSVVEDLWNNFKEDCDLGLSLAKLVKDENLRDTSVIREPFLGHAVIHDHTLSDLSCNMKEKVAISYQVVNVALLFVTDGQPGIILLAQFTDSDKDVFFPYSTNWQHTIHIDELKEAENGQSLYVMAMT